MLDNLGLEKAGVALDARGFIAVDDEYRTSVSSILAIGDVIGRVQLTPVALAEGMAVARRLFKPEQYRKVDYTTIPTAVFSLPNMATVGLTEEEAREQGHKVTIRSEEHTSELQSLVRISYAVFCLKKKNN